MKIWLGNGAGAICMGGITIVHPNFKEIAVAAQRIVEARSAAGFGASFLLAIPCGLLMYCAVSAKDSMRLVYIVMCVASFILGGFYHCVADMYYTVIAG